MIIVIMGVCGCGKTLIGDMLANKLGLDFYDADDFHSDKSIIKMKDGTALDDSDRTPWLKQLAQAMREWEKRGGAVLACSALKESYRQILMQGGDVCFVYLKGSRELILSRIQNRKDHYMPTDLLDSQFRTLEEPANAVMIDIAGSPDEIVSCIIDRLPSQRKN
ncbi:gluconokinase [Planctomycetota bacterium]